ncbi:MAG: outer membrane beta-barrel protein, partial [Acidobacteria bacterium]|nr:outer membrane beta-barrel protein [Acidobacteriota bacterium]
DFFNLFPTPAGEPRTTGLLTPPVIDEAPPMSGRGIRLGHFLFQPLVDATYVWGDNLLLSSGEPFKDSALLVRGRAAFDLLDSEQSLRIVYDLTYRDFQKFELVQKFSHFLNFEAGLALSPRIHLDLGNHLVRGSFESHEIDPGREVFFSIDPFLRNNSRGVLRYEFSERLGLKLLGNFNHVQFLDGGAASFYDYDTATAAASFLYQVSALTSLFGEYRRAVTPEPVDRPEAASTANSLFFGITGEITPVLVGTAQAGYQWQEIGPESDRSRFRGLVAEVGLTRSFGEISQFTIKGGRTTFLSNFEGNGYYLANYLEARLILPLAQRLRLLSEGFFFDNNYPWDAALERPVREDQALSASAGLVYFLTPLAYVRGDYRYERRYSTLEEFRYRNSALQVLVGFGFLNR